MIQKNGRKRTRGKRTNVGNTIRGKRTNMEEHILERQEANERQINVEKRINAKISALYTNEHLNPHKRIQIFIELAHEDLKNSTFCDVFNLRRSK
jgi:hypothetical protein